MSPQLTPTDQTRVTPVAVAPEDEIRAARSPWRIVAVREVMSKLSDKTYVVGVLVTLALLVGIIVFQAWMANRTDVLKVGVVGNEARTVAMATDQRVRAADDSSGIAVTELADRAAAEAALRNDTADVVLIAPATPEQSWQLLGLREVSTTAQTELAQTITARTMADNARAAGVSMTDLQQGSVLTTATVEPADANAGTRQLVGFVFAMLFYMASLMFGYTIANSVVEEKQSRVVEILASAMPIRQLLLGKVLGNTVLALAQMVLFVGVGLVGLAMTGKADLVPQLAGSAGWFLAFFLAGFIALACAWAAAGALASRNEDVQSTGAPLTFLLVAVFLLGLSATGTLREVVSYVPIASSVTMPGRVLEGDASWWQALISLALTLVFAGLVVLLGERIYRRSLLRTGGKVSLRSALSSAD